MPDYVELHCHSYFSLLDGASSPEELVKRAVELGMDTLALTDHDAVYGAVRFAQAAQAAGIRPIFGAELTLDDDSHLTLLVRNEIGWRNLCQLITLARHNAPKGEAQLPPNVLANHTEGLIALSSCRKGAIPAALLHGDQPTALTLARQYREWFGRDHFWLELQHHWLPDDAALNAALVNLAEQVGVGYVATNNVHYATADRHRLQDVLVCIRQHVSLTEAHPHLRSNSEYNLKAANEMATLFAHYPEALANTRRIADQCQFALHFGLQALPAYPTPDGVSAHAYLAHLCQIGLQQRQMDITDKVQRQLTHELAVIERSGLSNYVLIVWDIVRFACEQGILCQGRGSAANSLVAYLLGISPVNPLEHHLVFERFLSDERRAVPDIDMDFQADERERVIQYVYERYGLTHAAMACTFVTYRARSALRDVGKVLGLPMELLERLASGLDTYNAAGITDSPALREVLGERVSAGMWRQLTDLCQQIDGFPRHLGIHNGGMIVTAQPLSAYLPTEPATMPDRSVVQWDKDSLETAGLVKIDLLGLRMLSALAEARHLIRTTTSIPDLGSLTFDDQQVFALIRRADTVGVFQVESRAQAQVLPRLQPQHFNDLIVAISLIRPGPIQGNMVHPYLRRRLGAEPVQYPHPRLENALAETLGVVLFQEQVLKVAHDLAGFSAGQGEQLRRALGAKHGVEAVSQFEADFITGAQAQGVAPNIASAVFATLRAFGSYSFPKSHAAAFAVLVYQSAWLKCYHPAAFYTALLNHQPMGFWSPAIIVNDAKRHNLQVLPVDVNLSMADCTLEADDVIRLGLKLVKGVGSAGEVIVAAREAHPFADLRDFCRRTRLPHRLIENLILVGAFDAFGKTRRQFLWALSELPEESDPVLALDYEEPTPSFPLVSSLTAIGVEYDLLGISLRDHILAHYRPHLTARGILDSEALHHIPEGQIIQVAGLIVVHQSPPTAKGYHFITLEDEHGFINVIIRPDIYTRYRPLWRSAHLVIVNGKVQHQRQVVNLIAESAL